MSAVATVAINVDARDATGQLRQLQGQAGQTEKAFSGLSLAVGRLVTVAAAIQAARFVFAKTAELETQTKSLQVLTGSAEKAKSIIQDLQRLGAVTPFTSTELIDAAKRLQAFGIEANKVVETTKRLADVSGATGAELQGLVTAYGQVQAKGRLQGEELLQFQERGISLQKELQKMYGMTGEEFQKALGKGQISAKAVEVAIQRLTDAGGKYANGAIAQSDTLTGKFSTLQDGIEGIARQVGTVLTPAIKAVLNEAIYAINTINDLMATGARAKSFGMGQAQQQRLFAQAEAQATQIMNLRNIKNPFENSKQFNQLREQIFKDLIESYGYSTGQIKAKVTPPAGSTAAVIPPLLGGTRGAGGTRSGKGKTDDEKAAEVAKKSKEEEDRIKGILRSRAAEVEIFDLRFRIESKINKAEKDGDQMLAARLRGAQKELDLQYQYAQLLADPQNKDARIQEQIAYQGTIEILSNQVLVERELEDIQKRRNQDQMDGLKAAIEKQYQLNAAVQQQLQLADGISNAIGQGMNSALNLLVSGTENWGSSLRTIASGVLTDIANQLIRIFVIEQAVNAIKSFLTPFSRATPIGAGGGMIGKFGTLGPNYGIPQRAMGGPVTAGQPYMVGERGPELFVPSSGGSIVPNGKAGGGGVAVTVNVDAKGTSVEGSDQQAGQLGRIIAAAVQAELVNQKRRGGLLNP